MSFVGIRLQATEDVSPAADRVATGIRDIGSAAEWSKTQFDHLADAVEQFRKAKTDEGYALDLEYKRLRNANLEMSLTNQQRQENEAGSLTRASSFASTDRTIRGLSTTMSRAGATGDIGGITEDAANILSGITGSIPGIVGTAITGALSTIGASAYGISAISRQYEQFLPQIMSATASLGDLGKTAGEMSINFRTNMRDASDSVKDFGFTLNDGISVITGLSRYGLDRGEAMSSATGVARYARGFGADINALTGYEGLAQRFGYSNILPLIAGGLQQSGMGAGRFEEYASALQSIFEEGLQRGIVRGFEDISATQNWLSQFGEQFRGQTGVQRFQELNQAITQSTSLQSEADVIKFRAARGLVGSNNYLDVMERLERGIDQELFESIRNEVVRMSGAQNITGQVEMMRSIFGVNYTIARQLLTGTSETGVARLAQAPGGAFQGTTEGNILRQQEEMRETIRELGTAAFDIKDVAMGPIVDGIQTIVSIMKADVGNQTIQQQKEADLANQREQFRQDTDALRTQVSSLGSPENIGLQSLMDRIITIEKNPQNYPSEVESAKKLQDILGGFSNKELGQYGSGLLDRFKAYGTLTDLSRYAEIWSEQTRNRQKMGDVPYANMTARDIETKQIEGQFYSIEDFLLKFTTLGETAQGRDLSALGNLRGYGKINTQLADVPIGSIYEMAMQGLFSSLWSTYGENEERGWFHQALTSNEVTKILDEIKTVLQSIDVKSGATVDVPFPTEGGY